MKFLYKPINQSSKGEKKKTLIKHLCKNRFKVIGGCHTAKVVSPRLEHEVQSSVLNTVAVWSCTYCQQKCQLCGDRY